jgi:hypothetical protein
VSTVGLTLNVTSTTKGLGTLGYLSSFSSPTISTLYFSDASTPNRPKPLFVSSESLYFNSTNLSQPSSLFYSTGQAQFGATSSVTANASSFMGNTFTGNSFLSPYMYADSNNFYIKLNGQITFIVNLAGFVGIGKINPTENLDVSGQMRSDQISTIQIKTSSISGNLADAQTVIVQSV